MHYSAIIVGTLNFQSMDAIANSIDFKSNLYFIKNLRLVISKTTLNLKIATVILVKYNVGAKMKCCD